MGHVTRQLARENGCAVADVFFLLPSGEKQKESHYISRQKILRLPHPTSADRHRQLRSRRRRCGSLRRGLGRSLGCKKNIKEERNTSCHGSPSVALELNTRERDTSCPGSLSVDSELIRGKKEGEQGRGLGRSLGCKKNTKKEGDISQEGNTKLLKESRSWDLGPVR